MSNKYEVKSIKADKASVNVEMELVSAEAFVKLPQTLEFSFDKSSLLAALELGKAAAKEEPKKEEAKKSSSKNKDA